MRTREHARVSLAEITEIELRLLKRVRELTLGDHASSLHGPGVDFVGLRDWQAGDRFEAIDWAQSSLTNFSPLVVREFEQASTASVVMLADASLSTRAHAGADADGVSIAGIVARAIATIGLSAVFFQDSIGLITFDGACERLRGLRPRVGKTQVIHCLDAYHAETSPRTKTATDEAANHASAADADAGTRGLEDLRGAESLSATLAGFLRKTTLMPVISEFLFDEATAVVGELARLNARHDLFVVMVDASDAFELPISSAGWIDAVDIETGRTRLMSRRELSRMASRVKAWQDEVMRVARNAGLDVVRVGGDPVRFELALAEFVVERRLRRM